MENARGCAREGGSFVATFVSTTKYIHIYIYIIPNYFVGHTTQVGSVQLPRHRQLLGTSFGFPGGFAWALLASKEAFQPSESIIILMISWPSVVTCKVTGWGTLTEFLARCSRSQFDSKRGLLIKVVFCWDFKAEV